MRGTYIFRQEPRLPDEQNINPARLRNEQNYNFYKAGQVIGRLDSNMTEAAKINGKNFDYSENGFLSSGVAIFDSVTKTEYFEIHRTIFGDYEIEVERKVVCRIKCVSGLFNPASFETPILIYKNDTIIGTYRKDSVFDSSSGMIELNTDIDHSMLLYAIFYSKNKFSKQSD